MMKKSDIFWQTYLKLEKELIEISNYIFFTDEIVKSGKNGIVHETCKTQLETFSPYIADLLVRCCVQIEAISKELYFDNNGAKERGDNSLLFDEDCLKLIDKKWYTHNKIVMVVAPFFNFTKEENLILRPLNEAHKRKGTNWEKAYQAVKHDRYYSLYKGTIKVVIHALAALYLLNIYYRNDSWITSYKDISKHDYSMGSKIFAVKPPKTDQLWYENTPIISDSPYTVSYQEDDYQRIKEMQNKGQEALNNYWETQPELHEDAFLNQLEEIIERNKQRPVSRQTYFCELAKYRLNKKIPSTLPFEERKKLLISSDEWNGLIHQHNNHLIADNLTEGNIQQKIDSVGNLWGLEIMNSLDRMDWLQIAINDKICSIYIL